MSRARVRESLLHTKGCDQKNCSQAKFRLLYIAKRQNEFQEVLRRLPPHIFWKNCWCGGYLKITYITLVNVWHRERHCMSCSHELNALLKLKLKTFTFQVWHRKPTTLYSIVSLIKRLVLKKHNRRMMLMFDISKKVNKITNSAWIPISSTGQSHVIIHLYRKL